MVFFYRFPKTESLWQFLRSFFYGSKFLCLFWIWHKDYTNDICFPFSLITPGKSDFIKIGLYFNCFLSALMIICSCIKILDEASEDWTDRVTECFFLLDQGKWIYQQDLTWHFMKMANPLWIRMLFLSLHLIWLAQVQKM